MQAYGSDRLRMRSDGAAVLSCRHAKPSWNARTPKTNTTPEHPGTAVLWDDAWWEVRSAESVPQGVRYTLQPWRDGFAIRLTDRYDADAENERAAEHRRRIAREHGRVAANLLAFVTGHLPAAVQEHLGSEIGIDPPRLTMISAIPPFVAFVAAVVYAAGAIVEQKPFSAPLWAAALLLYFGADSIFRFLFAFSVHKPIGSIPGMLAYAIFWMVSPGRKQLRRPFAPVKGSSVRTTPLSDDAKLESALAVWEIVFTLLDAAEQQRLAERYGYDYRKTAPAIAWIVLVSSCFGVVSSFRSLSAAHPSAAISLLVAAGLAAEQLWRLASFKNGPAPSVLRFLFRWMVRRYVE